MNRPITLLVLLVAVVVGCESYDTPDNDDQVVDQADAVVAWGEVQYIDTTPELKSGHRVADLEDLDVGRVRLYLEDGPDDPSDVAVLVTAKGFYTPTVCHWHYDEADASVTVWTYNATTGDQERATFTFVVFGR